MAWCTHRVIVESVSFRTPRDRNIPPHSNGYADMPWQYRTPLHNTQIKYRLQREQRTSRGYRNDERYRESIAR